MSGNRQLPDQSSGARRAIFWCVLVAVLASFCLAMLEFSARAYKTLTYDGFLYLARSSPNSVAHPKYGWISPPSTTQSKSDECYGAGTVSYNAYGFRAPSLQKASTAEPLICILGDSTMQAYQIPDGNSLPHLLQASLSKRHPNAVVLPLAVGGYGTLQEAMVFEDFCEPLKPDLIIWHWASNDPVNNSYLAERTNVSNNNVRRRPYLENGQVVYRRPYPIHVSDSIDQLLLLRLANTLALKLQASPLPEAVASYEKDGWDVADGLIAAVARAIAVPKIALIEDGQTKAARMFRRHGFSVATHEKMPDEFTCKPRDSHPNADGHRLMLSALLPLLEEALERTGSVVRRQAPPAAQ